VPLVPLVPRDWSDIPSFIPEFPEFPVFPVLPDPPVVVERSVPVPLLPVELVPLIPPPRFVVLPRSSPLLSVRPPVDPVLPALPVFPVLLEPASLPDA
jgi:hypothetical protein